MTKKFSELTVDERVAIRDKSKIMYDLASDTTAGDTNVQDVTAEADKVTSSLLSALSPINGGGGGITPETQAALDTKADETELAALNSHVVDLATAMGNKMGSLPISDDEGHIVNDSVFLKFKGATVSKEDARTGLVTISGITPETQTELDKKLEFITITDNKASHLQVNTIKFLGAELSASAQGEALVTIGSINADVQAELDKKVDTTTFDSATTSLSNQIDSKIEAVTVTDGTHTFSDVKVIQMAGASISQPNTHTALVTIDNSSGSADGVNAAVQAALDLKADKSALSVLEGTVATKLSAIKVSDTANSFDDIKEIEITGAEVTRPSANKALVTISSTGTGSTGITVGDKPNINKITFTGLTVTEKEANAVEVSTIAQGSLAENEVPRFDTATLSFVPSGMLAKDGVVTVRDKVNIGAHILGSLGDELAITDEYSGVGYTLPTQEIVGSGNAPVKSIYFTEDAQREIVVNSDESTDLHQPEWQVTQTANEVIYKLKFTNIVSDDVPNCFFYVHINGRLCYQLSIPVMPSGELDIDFNNNPLILRNGQVATFSLLCEDTTQEVIAKGNSTIPAYTKTIREFEDRDIATLKDILVPTYQEDDGTKLVVNADRLVFPRASVFQSDDGTGAIIDTSFDITDGNNTVNKVVSIQVNGANVSANAINGRDANTAVIDIIQPVTDGDSYLAYFSKNVVLNTAGVSNPIDDSVVFPDEVIFPNVGDIDVNTKGRVFTLAKANGADFTDYEVSLILSFAGKATSAGTVKVSLGTKTTPINDYRGAPIIAQHIYSTGDSLSDIRLTGIIRVTDTPVTFSIVVENTFATGILNIMDRSKGISGIVIQKIIEERQSSAAIQQFELDTGQKVDASRKVYGPLADLFGIDLQDFPPVTYNAGLYDFSNGWLLQALSSLQVAGTGNTLEFNNTSEYDFAFYKLLTPEETTVIQGTLCTLDHIVFSYKNLEIKAYGWYGSATNPPAIFSGRASNGTPVVNTGWDLISTIDHWESQVGTQDDGVTEFTIPTTANVKQIAIVIYPEIVPNPHDNKSVRFGKFLVEPKTSIISYDYSRPTLIGANATSKITDTVQLIQNNHGTSSYRYDIGTASTPMPIGEMVYDNESIEVVPDVNPIPNIPYPRLGEGGLRFLYEGVIDYGQTSLKISNISQSAINVTFKYRVKHTSGNPLEEDITDSISTFSVPANNSNGFIFKMKSFSYHCRAGDILYLVASANGTGTYIECITPNIPLLSSSVTYRRLLPTAYNASTQAPFSFGVGQSDSADTTYPVVAVNTAQTVSINTLIKSSNAGTNVSMDTTNKNITLAPIGIYDMTWNAHLIRTAQWNGTVKVAVFLEQSIDGGTNWTYISGSAATLFIPSEQPASPMPVSLSLRLETTTANTKIRGRIIADNITNGVQLKSYGTNGGYPASSAFRLSGTFIGAAS